MPLCGSAVKCPLTMRALYHGRVRLRGFVVKRAVLPCGSRASPSSHCIPQSLGPCFPCRLRRTNLRTRRRVGATPAPLPAPRSPPPPLLPHSGRRSSRRTHFHALTRSCRGQPRLGHVERLSLFRLLAHPHVLPQHLLIKLTPAVRARHARRSVCCRCAAIIAKAADGRVIAASVAAVSVAAIAAVAAVRILDRIQRAPAVTAVPPKVLPVPCTTVARCGSIEPLDMRARLFAARLHLPPLPHVFPASPAFTTSAVKVVVVELRPFALVPTLVLVLVLVLVLDLTVILRRPPPALRPCHGGCPPKRAGLFSAALRNGVRRIEGRASRPSAARSDLTFQQREPRSRSWRKRSRRRRWCSVRGRLPWWVGRGIFVARGSRCPASRIGIVEAAGVRLRAND